MLLFIYYYGGSYQIERPELPIFTIHDSVVCPEGNEDYIRAVMAKEIEKHTGMVPEFGLEYW